jgi:hypothetical protein
MNDLALGFANMTVVAAVSLLFSCSAANSQAQSPLVEAWNKGDEATIFSFGDAMDLRPYFALSDSDIAAISVPMAQWIPIERTLESSSDQSWRSFKTEQDWTPFYNALPKTSDIKKRWGLGQVAAWELRALAEKGRISEASQAIIPDLIEGLDHPCRGETARDCFYALTALTRLYTHLPHGLPEGQETELKEWYRNWWHSNNSKHLIVDNALREQMKASVLAVCSRIEAATAQSGNSLHGFKMPARNILLMRGEDGSLFQTSYFPNSELSGIDSGRAGLAPWIWIGVVSQSTPLSALSRWSFKNTFPANAKEIYREPIKDSDWQVEVYTSKTSSLDDAAIAKNLSGR